MNTDGRHMMVPDRQSPDVTERSLVVGRSIVRIHHRYSRIDNWLDFVEVFLTLDSGVTIQLNDGVDRALHCDGAPEGAGLRDVPDAVRGQAIAGVYVERDGGDEDVSLRLANDVWLYMIRSSPDGTGAAGLYWSETPPGNVDELIDYWEFHAN